jgi:hypothetical protein
MTTEKIALSETILQLRRELLDAQRQADREDLKFLIEENEVELQVTATKEKAGRGRVKFWVVDAELQGKVAHEAVQTLRLKLKPIVGSSGDLAISDKDRRPVD